MYTIKPVRPGQDYRGVTFAEMEIVKDIKARFKKVVDKLSLSEETIIKELKAKGFIVEKIETEKKPEIKIETKTTVKRTSKKV